MLPLAHALHAAAGALQQISDTTPGERGRRAGVVALVLRAVEAALARGEETSFLLLRAEVEVAGLPAGVERAHLRRILRVPTDAAGEGVAEVFVEYACELEGTRRLAEAEAVLRLARSVAPEDALVALHAGRVARKSGDGEGALTLYRVARELDATGGSVARLAAVGEAVVSRDAERELGRAIRAAVRTGDAEAAAVGLEERAQLRRRRGARRAAARDLAAAAVRFTDPVDRARVAHRMADLFVAVDDALAAREALFLALAVGDPSQREHARGRLHTVSRDLGDQVGMRRWRSFQPQSLVSLSSRPTERPAVSAAPRVARWRERLGASTPGCVA